MFARRQSRRAMKKQRQTLMEALETRRMFQVVTGSGTIEYLDNEGNGARIAYNDVTVEFVWVRVDPDTGTQTTLANPVAITEETDPGADLYAIWVTEATLDSSIIVGEVAIPDDNGEPRPMTPYGTSTDLNVTNAQNGQIITVSGPADGGVLILGALTNGSDNDLDNFQPILSVPNPGGLTNFTGPITPGLTVRDDNAVTQPDLGTFLFGGTVTGNVDYAANAGTFYAGWLLTGNANGQGDNGTPDVPNNFSVAGDIRNLLTNGSIGTDTDEALNDPTYVTGFDLAVGGTVGQIAAHDSFVGAFNVAHDPDAPTNTNAQTEIEDRTAPPLGDDSYFQNGTLGGNENFNNDDFDHAQFLGSITPAELPGYVNVVDVDGILNHGLNENDVVDYYAVNLMAGETYSVQLIGTDPLTADLINVGVFDSDQRLIVTDYNHVDPQIVRGRPFQFTSDRPGTYYFAISFAGNGEFSGDVSVSTLQSPEYKLIVGGIGDIAVGALVSTNSLYDFAKPDAFNVDIGDLGGIISLDGTITSGVAADENTITVTTGSLRTLEAENIGTEIAAGANTGSLLGAGVNLNIVDVSVGLIRTHDEEGQLLVFCPTPIGTDLQWLEAAGNFGGSVITNRNIGVIRADHITTAPAPVITVNAQNDPDVHAVIDLIWTRGDMGTLGNGGPQITTGPGGNVRYMWAGGTVFRDLFFGGGLPNVTLHGAGEAVTIRDDSGSFLTFTPLGNVADNPDYDANVPGSQQKLGPQLQILTYGIRGSGGSAVMNVTTTGTDPDGLTVTSSGTSLAPSAEIGELAVNGLGTPPIVNADGTLREAQSSGGIILPKLTLTLSGSAIIDVFSITSINPDTDNDGNLSEVRNNTKGEIVNMHVGTIGTMSSPGTIGLAKTFTGAGVWGMDDIDQGSTYPFLGQKNGIVITGVGAIEIHSGRGLGNIIVTSDGRLQEVTANADGVDEDGIYAGINAPLVSYGSIGTVNIGDGLLPSGSGNLAQSGIYAASQIGVVQGNNADIRGDIVANNNPFKTTTTGGALVPGIGQVKLVNGVISGAEIMVVTEWAQAREFSSGFIIPEIETNVVSNPSYDLGNVSVTGNGGIIGSAFRANNIGPIQAWGFGVFDSVFGVLGDGRMATLSVAGYGVRDCRFTGGADFDGINLLGDGGQIPVTNYTIAVRQSELSPDVVFDPFTNRLPDLLSDIDIMMGVEAGQTTSDFTDAGVLADTTILGSRNLNSIVAERIRTTDPDVLEIAESFRPMIINYANSVRNLQVRDTIDGLSLTTGLLPAFSTGSDVGNLVMTVAGLMNSTVIGGDLLETSSITASGPEGNLGTFTVNGDWLGDVTVSGLANTVQINGTMSGSLTINNVNAVFTALSRLKTNGEIEGATIDIKGNTDRVLAQLGFGDADSNITFRGDVNAIRIGLDNVSDGADMGGNLHVTGNLQYYEITGQQSGTLTVDGNLPTVYILADATASGNTVLGGDITVGGTIGSIQILRGNVTSNVTAVGGIGSFTLSNGNVGSGALIGSSAGSISSLITQSGNFYGTIANTGGFFGNLNFPTGNIGTLNVLRMGQGDLVTINAVNIGTMQVNGNVAGPLEATFTLLSSLRVSGNVGAGSTFTGVISSKSVSGTDAGTYVTPAPAPAPAPALFSATLIVDAKVGTTV